jgi:thiamine-monophosphate kinase
MTRSAARPGDVVAVSGTVGDSAGGLRLLESGRPPSENESEARLRAAQERPQPRLHLGRAAVQGGVRCAIDVSDGLVQDLGHIATASGVPIRIEAPRVPLSAELRQAFPADALLLGLAGGEDYELILVAPRPVMTSLIAKDETPLTVIGTVLDRGEQGVTVVDASGREIEVGPGGWAHFGP